MQREPLSKLARHAGHYEGFDLVGNKLVDSSGTESWHFALWNEGQAASYWKAGDSYHVVATHIFDPSAGGATTFEIGSVVEPSLGERASIEAAMHDWLRAISDADNDEV